MAKNKRDPVGKYVANAKKAFANVCNVAGVVIGIATTLYVFSGFVDLFKPLNGIDAETRSGMWTISIFSGIIAGTASSCVSKNIGNIFINMQAAKITAEAQRPQPPSVS